MTDRTPLRLANEYASVTVELDHDAAGPRLRITDLASNVFACLDPLELQSLAWTRHVDFTAIMDPAHREALLEPTFEAAGLVVTADQATSRHDRNEPWRRAAGIGDGRHAEPTPGDELEDDGGN